MAIKYKSLPLTIILSILYPGLGHYYLGAYLTGLIWSFLAFLTQWFIYTCYCSPFKFSEAGGWPYILVYIGIILASSIRAYITAVQKNQHLELLETTKKEGKQKEHGYDLFKSRWG
ncbi:MAG: hypothetical protein QME64_02965 [bacterium]|nr:hypothetical protein [bacterium]